MQFLSPATNRNSKNKAFRKFSVNGCRVVCFYKRHYIQITRRGFLLNSCLLGLVLVGSVGGG